MWLSFLTFVTHFVLRVSCAVQTLRVFLRMRACTFICASTLAFFLFYPIQNCCSCSRSKSFIILACFSNTTVSPTPPPPPHNTSSRDPTYIVSHVVYPPHPPISISSLSTFVPFLKKKTLTVLLAALTTLFVPFSTIKLCCYVIYHFLLYLIETTSFLNINNQQSKTSPNYKK